MDNKEKELRDRLIQTYNEFRKIVGSDSELSLRVDEDTKQTIDKMNLEINFKMVEDLPNLNHFDQYRKIKTVIFKWIWTVPELKRSYAGRIYHA